MELNNRVEWGLRDPTQNKHWKRIDLKNYSFEKEVVAVCISGNGAITDEFSNGMCKPVEEYLQLLFNKDGKNHVYDHVDIMGAVYPINDGPNKGKFLKKDINFFIDNFLIKLLQDENDELVNISEACKRLSGVIFFTFCRGHLEVDKIMRAFYKELRTLGYSQKECDILMLAPFEISFAPLTYSSIIPIMFIDSKQDDTLNTAWKNNETSIHTGKDLNGIAIIHEKYGDPLLSGVAISEAVYDSIHVYSSRLRNNIESDEHNPSLLSRDKNWNSNYEPNADCVSQITAWTLSRAIENGIINKHSKKFIPRMSLEDLLKELESIKNDFSEEQLMSKEKS